jgi:hypothetical protein
MPVRTAFLLAFVAGAAALAYQFGARLSDEAVTTLVGMFCGVAATVPIALGLLAALLRARDSSSGSYSGGVASYDGEIIDGESRVVGPLTLPASHYAPRPVVPPAPPAPWAPYVVYAPPAGPPGSSPYPPYPNFPYPPYGAGLRPDLPPALEERSFRIVGDSEE